MGDEVNERAVIDAIWGRVLDIANDIIQLRRDPVDAVRELNDLRVELFRIEAALGRFVDLPTSWDDDPRRRKEIEHEILIAADTFRRETTL
jgi:hypothetical protein